MAKEMNENKDIRKREKQERREKGKEKEKQADTNRVRKPEKNKTVNNKVSTAASEELNVTAKLLSSLEAEKSGSPVVKEDDKTQVKVNAAPLIGALVAFANPLADDKQQKKMLRGVKKAAKNKTVKRGVKEVVKALRKSPLANAFNPTESAAIVVLAADISPMDVISHIPVLCEDHGVPYIFVPSRVELGAAGNTKRPTSVVMISRTRTAKRREGEEKDEEWVEAYQDLVKLVVKASRVVKV
ncbi:MAG: hypothetical protein Q9164_007750 [Protoblastenia rupestris]